MWWWGKSHTGANESVRADGPSIGIANGADCNCDGGAVLRRGS